MRQKYSSKDTSINVVNKVYKQCVFMPQCRILDYGGGKYNTNRDYMAGKCGADLRVYDKYNRSDNENRETLEWVKENVLDYIVCSNVLNVIMEDEIIDEILADISSLHAKCVYIAVYEGDRSGVGKETAKGWQRNQKASCYVDMLSKYFDIEWKNGNLFCLVQNMDKRGKGACNV